MSAIGIVVINSGTPDELNEDAIRKFLACMLSDPALISCPPIIWKRVLKYFILPNRPKRTIKNYARMWDENGSQFMNISHRQAAALQAELQRRGFNGGRFEVRLAMRYSSPSITSQVQAFKQAGCGTIIGLPLYPQYVNVCAGTCLKELNRCVDEQRDASWDPRVVQIRQFYDEEPYQEALAASVARHWSHAPGSKLCVSLHSTLMADIKAGDPYHEQNLATTADLAARLGVPAEDVQLSYQSRFDSRSWLQPFTANVLQQWAQQGVKDVCVVCPGFTAENIESKIEAGEQLRDGFLAQAGEGARYTYIPTLDDDPGLISALANAVEATGAGT